MRTSKSYTHTDDHRNYARVRWETIRFLCASCICICAVETRMLQHCYQSGGERENERNNSTELLRTPNSNCECLCIIRRYCIEWHEILMQCKNVYSHMRMYWCIGANWSVCVFIWHWMCRLALPPARRAKQQLTKNTQHMNRAYVLNCEWNTYALFVCIHVSVKCVCDIEHE